MRLIIIFLGNLQYEKALSQQRYNAVIKNNRYRGIIESLALEEIKGTKL